MNAVRGAVVRHAVVAFVLSRTIFFAVVVLGSQIALLGKTYGESVWETSIEFEGRRVVPELVRTVLIADAYWYRSIAVYGYGNEPGRSESWAFFPFYPLLVRLCRITGDFALDGLIASNGAFLIALILLGHVALRAGLAVEESVRAIWYAAFFPAAYFFSLPMTESTFLALSLGCALFALRGRSFSAGFLAALAAMTRFAGIFLFVIVALTPRETPWRKRLMAALLAPAGTLAFIAFQYFRTGDALRFVHSQASWGRATRWPWQPFVEFARHSSTVSQPWNAILLNCIVAVAVIIAAVSLLVRRQWAFGLYSLISVLVPLTSGSLQSMARYSAVIFPVYLWLAVCGRKPIVDRAVLAVFATLYGAFVVLFALHVDFALA